MIERWYTNPHQPGANGARPPRADRELTSIEVEVPAEIAQLDLVLDQETVAACEEAAVAIARLDAKGHALAGMSDMLVRTEASASSKIERIYADLDELARASLGAEAGERAKSTINAARAIATMTAHADADGITEEALLATHRALMEDVLLEGASAGKYRTVQNWIGGSDHSPLGAVHVPPPHRMVEPLMADLFSFCGRTDVAAVAQAAIGHAQFEAIHPFNDGNGRTGRALIGAVLRRRGVTSTITVPIAAAMLADVDDYFEHLARYRSGDLDAWVSYTANAATVAAKAADQSAVRLAELPAQWIDQANPRKGSAALTLLGGLLRHPVIDLEAAEKITNTTANNTLRGIGRLVEAGVLREITGAERYRVWVCGDVVDEVAELEQRIGLRSRPSSRWR
ncbi:Fic family protein [Aeromicrobium senzhongii]|uniref:Fic family protein n=2 Tax=Aeromicrobium senzhongii TaxID=2663859 RepID=A0ABX6SYK1_9ACTN|nr:Fic family protein [Aeromicrobium senzhongii]QNL95830.1 Fic family protein [Aeromicrobium senzhongii]